MSKSTKCKKPQTSRRKKAILQSEEELSDRRSTSSSDSAVNKGLPSKNAQYQRSGRRTAQKRQSDQFELGEQISGYDLEWNEKNSSEENDSDPAWNPEGGNDTTPTPAKLKVIQRKVTRLHKPHSFSSDDKTKPLTSKIEKVVDDTLLKPAADPDGILHFAGMVHMTDATVDKGFESGKFIMLKSDLKTQKSPSIWRIDGKNLLQKYEPVTRNNAPAYRNISTYSSWMATNKGLYVPIDVEFNVQSKSETIVTFDRSKVLLPVQSTILESLTEESNAMVDTFQVYLQTLISHSLDRNFLVEIIKEKDDYFLTSMVAVEDHWVLPVRNSLKDTIKLRKSFQEILELYPYLELRCVTSGDKSCDACSGRNPTRSFEFQHITYNFDTLETSDAKPLIKSYRLCLSCTDRVVLYHQLFHIRFELFNNCQTKIKEYDLSDGPAALTACLANQQWKSLMLRKVFLMLAEAQQIIHQTTFETSIRT